MSISLDRFYKYTKITCKNQEIQGIPDALTANKSLYGELTPRNSPLRATAPAGGAIFVVPEREERQGSFPERHVFFQEYKLLKIKQA